MSGRTGLCTQNLILRACDSQKASEMCATNHKCHSFTILAGENCRGSSKGQLRYHTFAQGAASADKNPDWTAYVKPGGPGPSPVPSNPFVTKVKCAMRELAASISHKRIGAVFGARGDALVAAALRYDDLHSPCFATHICALFAISTCR